MTDREKIVKIIRNMDSQSDTLDAITLGDIRRIADALIANGIGDVADSEVGQTITDLLIEFDEMGFAPTTVCPDSEQYAIDWRERVRKEFNRLTAENAELRAKLENAVELPCKVGDNIYLIEDNYIESAEVYDILIKSNETIISWARYEENYWEGRELADEGEVLMSEYNKTWFTDRSEAEAKLKELQGGVSRSEV